MLDITYAIQFYLIYSLCGAIGFYILSKVLKKTSKVILYSISKPLGLILLAYPIWMLSSAKILPFNNNNLLLIIFLFIIAVFIGGIIFDLQKKYTNKKIDIKVLKKFLIGIGIIEILTILLFSIYLLIRSFNPQIEGTEKFMDLMLLSSSGKTDYFPFFDAWWAGKSVNYYYYGFYIFALLGNIGSIPYAFVYNFALAIIFAQTIITGALIIFRATKSYISAIFGTALINLSGNLHYANCLSQNFNESIGIACYYPKASRILDPAYTINEFPTYSYILGDLHPHVLSLPFFALGLYLLIEIFKEKKFNIYLHFIFGFVIATAGLINFWDFMSLGALYGIIFLYKLIKSFWINRKRIKDYFKTEKFTIAIKVLVAILLSTSPFILYFPFFLNFQSPVAGLGFIPEFTKYYDGKFENGMQWPSSPEFQFGMWGIFIVLIIPSLLISFVLNKKNRKKIMLPIILFVFGILLIVFTELFYFKDLFHIVNAQYFRANTVFKFTYHSWTIFAIAAAISLSLLWKSLSVIKNIKFGIAIDIFTLLLISFVFSLAFVYPYFGFTQAYGLNEYRINSLKEKNDLTLDGSIFLKTKNIDDYNTIEWINKNQKERVVILEAVGGAYTYFARISVFTGMGTVLGWETHEWTWRFHYPEGIKDWKEVTEKRYDTGYGEIGNVKTKVKTIYTSDDIEKTKELLKEFNVKYIYIGDLERETYTELKEDKFKELGEIVFESGNSRLYKLN